MSLAAGGPPLTIEVETTATPAMRFDLVELASGEQGFLTKLLRPRVTVLVNGQPLYRATPAGPPEEGFPLGWVLLAGAALGAVWLLTR